MKTIAQSLAIIILALCCSFHQCIGFSPPAAIQRSGGSTTRTESTSCSSSRKRFLLFAKATDEEDPRKTKDSATTLNLYGEATIRSESVPPPHDKIHEFFALPESASLLLRGSNNNEIVEITSVDDDLRQAYQQQCRKVDASDPTPDDLFYDVTTSGVRFPGLQIMSIATIGTKVIKEGHAGFPAYEFVLIRDATYATGSRVFVWFFNKVTGKDKDNKREDQATQSLNRIRVLPMEDGSIEFECNANLSISIKIPAVLMKIIPNKEKAEKTGGESLCATLKGDIPCALSGFRQEYMNWRSNS
mmetsp:Transcript_28973/g.43790  ORF Transcript_28973/g.43790 Transcript_28973/m.43790 type:complete len:302 (-) Transcript_28973:173-1078(-)|eukprot:scaffold34604_cov88-Skeletonema_dohrnii-CCMP3373.AAC.5